MRAYEISQALFQTYNVVAPIAHCLFQVIGAAIGATQALQAFNAEQLILLLSAHTAHGTTQRCGHAEIGF